MYRGNPEHTGVYDASASGGFGGVRWRFQTGGPVRSSAAIAAGVLYVGSSDGFVYALDARTGVQRWRHDVRSAVTSSPAVANGLVIVGARDGRFVALDARTGAERWQLAAGAELPLPWGHESGDYWTASPVVTGTLVVLGGGDGVLRAADVTTGRVRWSARTEGRIRSSPAVGGDFVVAGDVQGIVYAFDKSSGAPRWRYETFGHTLGSDTFGYDRRTIQSSPAIMNGRVFVGARDGFLYALDLASGALAWRFDHEISWVNTSPAVEEGRVFAGSSDRQFIQAVDAADGHQLWRTQTALTWASPAVSGGQLFTVDGSGRLNALDKASGEKRWVFRAGAGLFSSPVVEGGILYLGSDDGAVYAINASAPRGIQRAVYWDSLPATRGFVGPHEVVRNWFVNRGYERLDGPALVRFMAERAADRAPSVIVLATDQLPPGVADVPADTILFRRYLAAGGSIVLPGIPPLLWPYDSTIQGGRSLRSLNRAAVAGGLGVSYQRGNFDQNGSTVTDAGRRYGLSSGFLSNWAADPESVTEVLAIDEVGLASAWIRNYGGPAGTGLIRIPVILAGPGMVTNLMALQLGAELRPSSATSSASTTP